MTSEEDDVQGHNTADREYSSAVDKIHRTMLANLQNRKDADPNVIQRLGKLHS